MIAVDVNDHTEVYTTGCKLLSDGMGPDAMNVFMKLTRGGKGDWTKEKYDRPDMTDAEFAAYAEKAKAETEARVRKE